MVGKGAMMHEFGLVSGEKGNLTGFRLPINRKFRGLLFLFFLIFFFFCLNFGSDPVVLCKVYLLSITIVLFVFFHLLLVLNWINFPISPQMILFIHISLFLALLYFLFLLLCLNQPLGIYHPFPLIGVCFFQ